MNMTEIRVFARNLGIKPGKQKKVELIREIQKTESNPQCYCTNFSDQCGQDQCLWRPDCD